MSAEAIGLAQDLEIRCENIAAHLRSKNLATEEEIRACYDQPADGDMKRVLAYAELRALHATRIDRPSQVKADNEQAVLAALSDEPARVTVSGLTVTIYPKSFAALQVLTQIAERINFLLDRMRALEAGGVALADELYVRVDNEVLFLYRALVLAVTHEGPSLPFDNLPSDLPFPAWLLVLNPVEIQRIRIAYLRVNAARLAILVKMIRLEAGKEGGPGNSWATFFSLRSDDSHIPTPQLMRDYSLGSQLAAVLLATSSKLKAIKEKEPARG